MTEVLLLANQEFFMKKIVAVAFVIGCLIDVNAQNQDSIFIKRIADEILMNSVAYENLRTLTKQIGARLSGSPQMAKAEDWGARALKEAGADSIWMQQCMVPHWVRGGKDEAVAWYTTAKVKNKKKLAVTALGNSLGSLKPMQATVVEVTSFDDLVKKKDQVKDKIVFYNYPFKPTFIKTFDAYADASTYRGIGPAEAARRVASAARPRCWRSPIRAVRRRSGPPLWRVAGGAALPRPRAC